MTYNIANITRSSTRELELLHLVQTSTPDVVVITECELPPEGTISIPGYVSYLAHASPIGKIRLAMLVVNDLAATASVISTTSMDIWVSLPGILLGGIYRQWAVSDEASELAAFHARCASIASNASKVFIVGDFNLDMARLGDPSYCRSSLLATNCEAMDSLGLTYIGPSSPTYFSYGKYKGATRCSTLDYGYIAGTYPSSVNVLPYSATDHRPVIFKIPQRGASGVNTKYTTIRDIKKVNVNTLCAAIDARLPPGLYSLCDVDAIHGSIITAITSALDAVAPVRKVRVRVGGTLYLEADTRAIMRARDIASVSNHNLYRTLRNMAKKLVRRDKLTSVRKTLARSGYDVKKVWRIAKESVGLGTSQPIPPSLTASTLNTFYVEKVKKIRSSIKPAPISQESLTPEPSAAFTFFYPSAGKIARVIAGLKNTGAVGVDGIGVAVLKKAVDVLAAPIGHLIRQSFAKSMVPDGFKVATVCPIHKGKGKDPNDAASYRPVSILPALSKVMERVVADALNEHLAPLLPTAQYGFRAHRNTTAAIASAHGAASSAKSAGLVSAIAAYDFSSAFDTVDTEIMIAKLNRLGIRGKEADWFRSYLGNRRQRVSTNGEVSSYLPVQCGVPQGSILGPVLFLCMVAELPASLPLPLNLGSTVGYADDVVVHVAGKDADDVRSALESISSAIIDYAAGHYLAINPSKTQVLWCNTRDGPSVNVGNSMVAGATSVDLLGVSFDKTLKPTPFLTSQAKAARRILGLTRRLMCYLPPNIVSQISAALFGGKLGYGLAAAVPPRFTTDDPLHAGVQGLQVIVNTAARTILRKRRADRVPVASLLAKTGLPSLNRLMVKAVALECWRAICIRDGSGAPPTPLADLIGVPGSGARPTRAKTTGLLSPPSTSKDTLVWAAYRAWNSSVDLRQAKTLVSAKKAASSLAALAPL